MAWIEKRRGRYLVSWRDPETKQKHRRSFRRERDARYFRTEIERQLDRDDYVSPELGKESLGAYLERSIEHSFTLKPQSRYAYRSFAQAHIIPAIGDRPLAKVRPDDIRALLASLQDRPGSMGQVYKILARTYNQAVSEGVVARSPLRSVAMPRSDGRPMRILTPDEIRGLMNNIYEPWAGVILLGVYSGLRLGEILALERKDVLGSYITVTKTVVYNPGEGTRIQPVPKTKAGARKVAIPSWTEMMLPQSEGRLFTTREGDLVSRIAFNKQFKKALKRVGLPATTRFHDLRHTASSWEAHAGAHPKAVQLRRGHSSSQITLDTYTHLFEGVDRDLADRLPHLPD